MCLCLYFLFLLLCQTSPRELPEIRRIAASVCLICQIVLHVTGLEKDLIAWLQLARAFASGFILSWLSATKASVFFFFPSSRFFFSLPNFLHGQINKVILWPKWRLIIACTPGVVYVAGFISGLLTRESI